MNYKHGLSNTRVYRIWNDMHDRCTNPKRHNYYLYGGKGIIVCDEWGDITNFYNWAMQNGYNDGLSIDRIDPDSNYCPENCRWVTNKIQVDNRSTTILVEYNGEVKNLKQWCHDLDVSYQKIKKRIKNGLTFQQALEMPDKRKSKYYLKQLKGEI